MENFSNCLGLNVDKNPQSNVGDTRTISSENVQGMDDGAGIFVKTEPDVDPFVDIEYFDHSSTIQTNLKSEPEDGDQNEDPLCDPAGHEPRPHHQPSHVNDDHSSINVQYPSVPTGEETNERKHVQPEEKPHKCETCGITFASNSTADDHKRIHTKKLYTCETCGIFCTSTSGLTLHKRKCVLQTQTKRKPHKCEVCGISFTSNSTLDDHKRIHTGKKPYKCETCRICWTSTSELNRHKRKHVQTEVKPFKCESCGLSFTSNSTLDDHKRIHTGETPYKCETCGLEFSWSLGLDRHKLSHTGGMILYKCEACKKCFRYQAWMSQHNCQSKERGWRKRCKICGVFFTKKVDLLKHEESHAGKKNYTCDECESSFCFPSELSKHKANIHRNEKEIKCGVCGIMFLTSWGLIAHEQTHTITGT